MERLARRYGASRFIAYFQSFSNTYAPVEVLRELYHEALSHPRVVGLSIGTRPDCLSPEILDLLSDLARERLLWLELGLQSAHDDTLSLINRGHDAACFAQAVRAAADRNLEVVAHVILGLPGEGPEDMAATARFLSGLPVQGVKIHLLYVVRGSALEDLYRQGGYRPWRKGNMSACVADFLELLPPRLVIHRLTGDPHPEELVAPEWCRDKSRVLTGIREELARRGSCQGSAWRGQNDFSWEEGQDLGPYPPLRLPSQPSEWFGKAGEGSLFSQKKIKIEKIVQVMKLRPPILLALLLSCLFFAVAGLVPAGRAEASSPAAPECRSGAAPVPTRWRSSSPTWQDSRRQRQVPVKIYYPADGAGPFPVIIFSHGLGGSREGYQYLGRHWASHGYVSVHLQHLGSDQAVWENSSCKLLSLRQAAANWKTP